MTDTDSPETKTEISGSDITEQETAPVAEEQVQAEQEAQTEQQAQVGQQAQAGQQTGEVDAQLLRLLEAVLFASNEPMDEATIATRLPEGSDVAGLVTALAEMYANRGVNLVQAGGMWFFRSAEDLAPALRVYANPQRKLSRAAIETLAIVAYHQPITRAEMEEIRGVGLSKGTIDMLFEQGWITPRGRRQTPGKPVTWGSTDQFLTDFGIESIASLPGMDELKAAGLLDKRPAIQITDAALPEEEEPLSAEEQEKLAEDAAFLASLDNEQVGSGEGEVAAAVEAEDAGAPEAEDGDSDVNGGDDDDDDEFDDDEDDDEDDEDDDDEDDDLDDDLDDDEDEEDDDEDEDGEKDGDNRPKHRD